MGNEVLMIVDAVSREKGIDKEIIFQAVEAALATATRKRHKGDIDARVTIHRETGAYDTFRRWEVILDETDPVEFPDRQIKLAEALTTQPGIQVGEFIEAPLAAGGFRSHRRAGRQAGHHAEGARGRARPDRQLI